MKRSPSGAMGGGNHTAPAQAQGCLPGFRWRGGDDDDCQASLMGMDHPDGEHGKREKESERWWGGLEGGSKPGRGRVALQYRNGGVRTGTRAQRPPKTPTLGTQGTAASLWRPLV